MPARPPRPWLTAAVFCLNLLFAAVALAQVEPYKHLAGPDPVGGVYRVETSGKGSGVAIDSPDRRQHFLTTEHCTTDGRLWVKINRQAYQCELVQLMGRHPEPMALIRTVEPLPASVKIKTYPLARTSPRVGSKVWLVGFPYDDNRHEGVYKAVSCRVISVQPDGLDRYVIADCPVRQGTSGGAMLNERSEIVAIISHSDRRDTLGSNVAWLTRDRNYRAVQWNCDNNFCYPTYSHSYNYATPFTYQRGTVVQRSRTRTTERQPTTTPAPRIDEDQLAAYINMYVIDYMQKNAAKFKGDRGDPGARGRDGATGGTPRIDVAAIADDIVKRYGRQLRGADGETPDVDYDKLADKLAQLMYTRYADQLRGQRGQTGPAGDTSDVADLLASINTRLTTLEQPQKIYVFDGKGRENLIDEQTYEPGKPYILDISKWRARQN